MSGISDSELEFLQQSNYIENETSSEALDEAVKAWKYLIKKPTLNAGRILHTHKILMQSRDIPERDKGNWRKQQVWVGGREGKPHFYIPQLMANWIDDAMTSVKVPGENGEHIKIDHVSFEHIHPFIDGNGRMGRILLNWQRIKAGLPILIIREEEKHEYYKWF